MPCMSHGNACYGVILIIVIPPKPLSEQLMEGILTKKTPLFRHDDGEAAAVVILSIEFEIAAEVDDVASGK